METISVIIPTWNRSNTLLPAIVSALTQTYQPLEVLVCDDGSTDDSHMLVKSLRNPKVQWVSGRHTGLPAVPRNRGVIKARGEWIAFLDSDDIWLPSKLAKQMATAKKTNAKAICGSAYIESLGKRRIRKDSRIVSFLYQYKRITFEDLLRSNRLMCSSVCIHSSLFHIVGGFPEGKRLKAIEDYALWLRIATQCDFIYIYTPLLIYNDDRATSIRVPGFLWEQQQRVFNDFLRWAGHNNRTTL